MDVISLYNNSINNDANEGVDEIPANPNLVNDDDGTASDDSSADGDDEDTDDEEGAGVKDSQSQPPPKTQHSGKKRSRSILFTHKNSQYPQNHYNLRSKKLKTSNSQ